MPLLLAGEAQAPEFNRFTVEYRKPNDAAHKPPPIAPESFRCPTAGAYRRPVIATRLVTRPV